MISIFVFKTSGHLQHFLRYTKLHNFHLIDKVTVECDFDINLIHVAETYFNATVENDFPN
jgi:hypothetical protein